MSQDNKGKDLSITELLKKLREQADAEPDSENAENLDADPEQPEEAAGQDKEDDEIKAELFRILEKIGSASKTEASPAEEETSPFEEMKTESADELPDDGTLSEPLPEPAAERSDEPFVEPFAEPFAASALSAEEPAEPEKKSGLPETLPEEPEKNSLLPEASPEGPVQSEKDEAAEKSLKELILRLNRKTEDTAAKEEKQEQILPEETEQPALPKTEEAESGQEPEQISFFDGLFDGLLKEDDNDVPAASVPAETAEPEIAPEDFGFPEEENDEEIAALNEGLLERFSMIGTDEEAWEEELQKEETGNPADTSGTEEKEAAKSGGERYHFTVTKKPVPKPSGEEVVPSAKEFEEAGQDIADFSDGKAETREAPAFSGWKMLKNLFGIGKTKSQDVSDEEEAPVEDASEKEAVAEKAAEEAETAEAVLPDAAETTDAAPAVPAGEENGTETENESGTGTVPAPNGGTESVHAFREDDGSAAPAALFYAANRAEEPAESEIAPDPELFEKIREEYPVAMNDMGTTVQVGGEDTRTDKAETENEPVTAPATDETPAEEEENNSVSSEETAEGDPLTDGDLDLMMQRFLSKENYDEYVSDADLAESRRKMRQIRLDDPDSAPAEETKNEKPVKKGDTKEVPAASSDGGSESAFDEKMPLNSMFDSETFVPPEIDVEEEAGEEEISKDISILVAFGREEEARKKYGDEKVDAFLKEVSGSKKNKKEEEAEEEPELIETEETEYENFGQNKEIFRGFKKKYRFSLVRLVLCGILMLLAFFLENYALLGITPITALDPELFPLIYVMADLQLLVLGCLIARGPIIGGVKSLIRREPDPSLFVTAAAVFCFAYTVFAAFLPAGQIHLYTFPFLHLCFVCILCGYFDLRREIMTFRVVSSKRTKYVIGSLSEEEASLEEEAFENYLPEEPMLFKLGKANFVDGFFRRSRGKSAAKRMILLVPPFACAIGIAFLAMSVFFGGNSASAVTVGITALMMSLPAAMFLTYSFPFYTAAGHAYDTDSAIVGEPSLEEYCDAASVSFEDTDVFPSRGVKVRSVMVFGDNRIDEVINNVTSVFHVAGGPLSDVLDIITSDLRTDEDTRLLSVAPDGIEADVSGTHMYLGKADYLRRNHYVPIVSDEDREIERSGNLSIMFVVSGDEVVAKFYLSYRIDPDFEKILKQMYRSGICVGIKTFDPNIDDDMLARRIRIERYPVRVLKCREIGDEPRVADRADSGIVSKRSTKALLGAFAVCGKVQTVTRVGIVLNFISLFAAAMVMGVTMLFGAADKIPSLYVALYQLFWTIPIFVMSRIHVK